TMLKRLALTLAGSVVFFIACAPPEPQASFKSDKDKTEVEEDNEASDDEDCVEETEATLAPKSGGSLSGVDPEKFDKCACEEGGAARCIPKATIPANFSSQLGTCDGGGVCIPDTLVKSGGAAPKTCKSIAGEGRCMNLCIPKVAERIGLL